MSIHKDFVRVYPLTIDATIIHSSLKELENSLNSTIINHDNLNGTKNLTQQDIQTPSHFVNEEKSESITTTEAQRRISPIQPNFTTPKQKTQRCIKQLNNQQ